jgi:hypothetical protein
LFWLQSRPFTIATRVLEGARYRSHEWIKGDISPMNTMEASGPKIKPHYQTQQRILVVLDDFTTFHARCSGAGGHPRLTIAATMKGAILPVDSMKAVGRKIGRPYQPQQRILVVFDYFTTFHALCSFDPGRCRRPGHPCELS